MAKIIEIVNFDGAETKMYRLGLQTILEEVCELLRSATIFLEERKQANGGASVRELIDVRFATASGWERKQTGDVDWLKCKVINGTRVCLGVEIQVSARSELLYKDILHLRTRISQGDIDLGIIVVPSDRLQSYLPDRTPSISYAKKVIRETDADRLPILLIEIEHDGPGPALKKKVTNLGEGLL
jgi:hypothetical protein